MRLRNVPGSREAIADNDMAINEPTELKGKFRKSLHKFRLNKIAARWPAKAVAQFYFY